MPRFGAKALLTVLALNGPHRKRPNWDRTIILFSTVVTVGLVALYAWGKATSRW